MARKVVAVAAAIVDDKWRRLASSSRENDCAMVMLGYYERSMNCYRCEMRTIWEVVSKIYVGPFFDATPIVEGVFRCSEVGANNFPHRSHFVRISFSFRSHFVREAHL